MVYHSYSMYVCMYVLYVVHTFYYSQVLHSIEDQVKENTININIMNRTQNSARSGEILFVLSFSLEINVPFNINEFKNNLNNNTQNIFPNDTTLPPGSSTEVLVFQPNCK